MGGVVYEGNKVPSVLVCLHMRDVANLVSLWECEIKVISTHMSVIPFLIQQCDKYKVVSDRWKMECSMEGEFQYVMLHLSCI